MFWGIVMFASAPSLRVKHSTNKSVHVFALVGNLLSHSCCPIIMTMKNILNDAFAMNLSFAVPNTNIRMYPCTPFIWYAKRSHIKCCLGCFMCCVHWQDNYNDVNGRNPSWVTFYWRVKIIVLKHVRQAKFLRKH